MLERETFYTLYTSYTPVGSRVWVKTESSTIAAPVRATIRPFPNNTLRKDTLRYHDPLSMLDLNTNY